MSKSASILILNLQALQASFLASPTATFHLLPWLNNAFFNKKRSSEFGMSCNYNKKPYWILKLTGQCCHFGKHKFLAFPAEFSVNKMELFVKNMTRF